MRLRARLNRLERGLKPNPLKAASWFICKNPCECRPGECRKAKANTDGGAIFLRIMAVDAGTKAAILEAYSRNKSVLIASCSNPGCYRDFLDDYLQPCPHQAADWDEWERKNPGAMPRMILSLYEVEA